MMNINIAQACRQLAVIGLSVVTAFVYGVILPAGLVLSGEATAATQGVAKFSTNILQSACNITFLSGSSASGNAITSLTIPPIDSGDITNQLYPTGTAFTLKLSGCGVASPTSGTGSTAPKVTLTDGNVKQGDHVHSTHSYPYKFRNAGTSGGTSEEYFVVVGPAKNMKYASVSGSGAGDAGSNGIYQTTVTTGNIFIGTTGNNGEGLTKTLYATVACDDTCTYAKGARAGTVNASLQFTFTYN